MAEQTETATGGRGIRCGRCRNYHPSVAAVRQCFNGGVVEIVTPALDGAPAQEASGGRFVPPTTPQTRYVKDLLNGASLVWVAGLQNLSKRQASEVIGLLNSGRASDDPRFRSVAQPVYCRHDDCWERAEVKATGLRRRGLTAFCSEHGRAAGLRDGLKIVPLAETSGTLRADATKPTASASAQDDEEGNPANSFANGTAHVEVQSGAAVARFDPEALDDGFYVRDEEVYKVIVAVHGSGRKYAKRLDTATGRWEMAPGAVRKLRPEMKMTLDQALTVARKVASDVDGRLYGRCFVCGRTLTDEDSIDRMMGPVCAEKFA